MAERMTAWAVMEQINQRILGKENIVRKMMEGYQGLEREFPKKLSEEIFCIMEEEAEVYEKLSVFQKIYFK